MPRLITDHEDARIARAWAAFAREDAAASAPARLEARVLRAARTAIAERRREEAERQRRRWFAGTSAIAAGMLAAAAWHLSVVAPPPVTSLPSPAVATATAPAAVGSTSAPAGRSPAPMTNVEAGRMLATPPRAPLAARPLFDVADSGVVGVHGVPRARAYHAPIVEPAPYARTAAPAVPAGSARRSCPGPVRRLGHPGNRPAVRPGHGGARHRAGAVGRPEDRRRHARGAAAAEAVIARRLQLGNQPPLTLIVWPVM
jgi:hypothetical protein